MLHQAVEHACIAIVYSRLGYRAATHNLSQLLSLVKVISDEPLQAFPKAIAKDRELFRLLAKAYCDTRYKTEFPISAVDVEILYDRVIYFLDKVKGLRIGENEHRVRNSISNVQHL